MQPDSDMVEYLFPSVPDIEGLIRIPCREPFADEIISFLHDLSVEINRSYHLREYPDVATFAFFCRKANITRLKNIYLPTEVIRLGRGVAFHIAPSNVPVNFAFSLIAGLLAGNKNIVRVPSNNFEQVNIICNAIINISKKAENQNIAKMISLVRYDRQSSATAYFSSLCDIRIIWGGDDTISQIRSNKIEARAYEVTFADRYSFCIINGNELIKEPMPEKLVRGFYDDTYLFDQNACSSPHLIIWLGDKQNVERSKEIFWNELHKLVKERYTVQPVVAVDKLAMLLEQSVNVEVVKKSFSPDNLIWRSEISVLPDNIDNYRCSSGFFTEYHAKSMEEIVKIINKKYQTLAYYGFKTSELKEFIQTFRPSGVDRIVPIGRTSEFSLTWDGYNLIEHLSREITVL